MTDSRPSTHPVHVGLKFSQQLCTIEQQREVWRVADEAGFDHLWDFDHFHPIGQAPLDGDIFDGWSLLAAMAEATKRVRIGNMVTGNTYRHPAVLAKIATTVDHLSGGRLEFGLGGAWAEAEHTMLDIEWRHYRLQGAYANPKPVQKPYPPIWIGGGGEQKTLRIVAEHADVWNMAGGSVEMANHKVEVLRRHCDVVGRDPDEIRLSVQLRFNDGDADATVRDAEA